MYTVEELAVGFSITIDQATELRAAMLYYNESIDSQYIQNKADQYLLARQLGDN